MFVYNALSNLQCTIRLLYILPSVEETHTIRCGLSEYVLFALRQSKDATDGAGDQEIPPYAPEYEALSYVWSRDLDTTPIIINEQPFQITKRLQYALTDLRLPDKTRSIWIDAICINQQDDVEKSHQVHLIAIIYQNAARVIAWLDRSCMIGDPAIKAILEIGGSEEVLTEGFNNGCSPIKMVPKVLPNAPKLHEIIVEAGERWQALEWFLRNTWWERAWVLQESSHAQELRFRVGRLDCNLDNLDNIMYSRDHRLADQFRFPQYELFHHLDNLFYQRATLHDEQRSWGYRLSASRLTLLSRFDYRYCQASDPRDKVYALLSLPDLDELRILPDYSKSVEAVYHHTVRAIIEADKFLDVLHFVRRSCMPSTISTPLPSWVPDFSVRESYSAETMSRSRQGSFKTAGNFEPVCEFIQNAGEDALGIPGITFDVLSWCPTAIPLQSLSDGSWEDAVRSWIRLEQNGLHSESDEIAESLPNQQDLSPSVRNDGDRSINMAPKSYPSGGTYQEALFRTLLLNQTLLTGRDFNDDDYIGFIAAFGKWLNGEEIDVPDSEQQETLEPLPLPEEVYEALWNNSVPKEMISQVKNSEFKEGGSGPPAVRGETTESQGANFTVPRVRCQAT
jgi:hypothetical protein